MRRHSGTSLWPWLLGLALLLVGGSALALFMLRPTSKDYHVPVHVRVVDASGDPVNAAVGVQGVTGLTRVDTGGWAHVDVELRPDQRPPEMRLEGIVRVESRFHAERSREIKKRDDGSYEIQIVADHHGLVTLRMDLTTLPEPRAFLETSDHVQPVRGMGVARLGQGATYRVYPGVDTLTLTVMGDTGTAMERFRLRAPSPGFVLQHEVKARPSRPLSGRVVAPEGIDVPALTGRVHLFPSPRGSGEEDEKLLAAGVDPYVEIDPVVIQPDGTFLVPHTADRDYTLHAELDFLGPTDRQTVSAGEDVDVVADLRRAWLRLRFPESFEGDPHDAIYSVEFGYPQGRVAPRVLHHEGATYLVVAITGELSGLVRLPGTQGRPPRRGALSARVTELGPGELEVRLADAPFGTVVVEVPDDVRAAMRGGTLAIDADGVMRSHSLLRNLTKTVEMKHVDAGEATVRVEWQEAGFAPFETAVEVPEGGEVRVTVVREPK